jgi:hypothetical protein
MVRLHGCRETAPLGFTLEVELVLSAQHAERLVHGLLYRCGTHVAR